VRPITTLTMKNKQVS